MLIRAAAISSLLLVSLALGQSPQNADSPVSAPVVTDTDKPSPNVTPTFVIPAGSRIPLSLKQAISTKTAKTGDPVYAETAFPFVINEHIVIPAGTYIQGKIERAQRTDGNRP